MEKSLKKIKEIVSSEFMSDEYKDYRELLIKFINSSEFFMVSPNLGTYNTIRLLFARFSEMCGNLLYAMYVNYKTRHVNKRKKSLAIIKVLDLCIDMIRELTRRACKEAVLSEMQSKSIIISLNPTVKCSETYNEQHFLNLLDEICRNKVATMESNLLCNVTTTFRYAKVKLDEVNSLAKTSVNNSKKYLEAWSSFLRKFLEIVMRDISQNYNHTFVRCLGTFLDQQGQIAEQVYMDLQTEYETRIQKVKTNNFVFPNRI